MKLSQIKATYPINSTVIDAEGIEGCCIKNHNLSVSPFKVAGSILLGGVFIHDSSTGAWATITKTEE